MTREIEKYLKTKRPSWDEYFIGLANYVGTRSTCSGQSGCVIVRDKRVISTGYVGSPPGLPHCGDIGHDMHTVINENGSQSEHCFRTIHDFQNAIAQAARFGMSVDGATIYVKLAPCYTCAKLVIASGIKRVVAEHDYHSSRNTKLIFKKARVKLEIINKKVLNYK